MQRTTREGGMRTMRSRRVIGFGMLALLLAGVGAGAALARTQSPAGVSSAGTSASASGGAGALGTAPPGAVAARARIPLSVRSARGSPGRRGPVPRSVPGPAHGRTAVEDADPGGRGAGEVGRGARGRDAPVRSARARPVGAGG